jgi:hypothetical protein
MTKGDRSEFVRIAKFLPAGKLKEAAIAEKGQRRVAMATSGRRVPSSSKLWVRHGKR